MNSRYICIGKGVVEGILWFSMVAKISKKNKAENFHKSIFFSFYIFQIHDFPEVNQNVRAGKTADDRSLSAWNSLLTGW